MAVSTIGMVRPFVVEEKTISYTLSSERYKSAVTDVSKTGYKPIGIVGYSLSAIDIALGQALLEGNSLSTLIWRASATSQTYTLRAKILYMKN
jgi:hypothetical protein